MNSVEERYVKAYEAFTNECAKNGIDVNTADIRDKDVKVGKYLVEYGEDALEQFKKDVSKGEFNYNKMSAGQKEIYSSLNYVKNTNERDKRLIEGVNQLMNGETYKDFLRFNAKFHTYSFNNALMIYVQKPDATYVAGLGKWKTDFEAAGINKGEKGIMISRPNIKEFKDVDKLKEYMDDPKHAPYFTSKEKEALIKRCTEQGKVSIVTSFSYAYVWDVSQLHDKDNQPLKLDIPEIRKQIGKDFDDFETVRNALVSISEVPIHYIKSADDDMKLLHAYGYYTPSSDSITVQDAGFKINNEIRSEQDCIRTTIHEMAHSMLHGEEMRVQGIDDSSKLTKSQKEVEAESVAFMVCEHLGIDASCNSFGYLASYLPENAEQRYAALEQSLKKINKCADQIIEALDKELEKVKTQDPKESKKVETPAYDVSALSDLLNDMQYLLSENLEGMDISEVPDLYTMANDGIDTVDDCLRLLKSEHLPPAELMAEKIEELSDAIREVTDNADRDFLYSLDVDLDDVLEKAEKMSKELNEFEEEMER